jgi:hypothetical protein
MNAGGGPQVSGGGDSGIGSEFEQRTRALLLASADALTGTVRSRLTQARHTALGVRATRRHYRLQRWVPAGALAAAALALLVVLAPHRMQPPSATSAVVANGALEDIDLLASDVPLSADKDVNYEFYEWAVDEASMASNSGPRPVVGTAAGGM